MYVNCSGLVLEGFIGDFASLKLISVFIVSLLLECIVGGDCVNYLI
jgi:hypothetical protein